MLKSTKLNLLKLDRFFDLVHKTALQTVLQTDLAGQNDQCSESVSLAIKH